MSSSSQPFLTTVPEGPMSLPSTGPCTHEHNFPDISIYTKFCKNPSLQQKIKTEFSAHMFVSFYNFLHQLLYANNTGYTTDYFSSHGVAKIENAVLKKLVVPVFPSEPCTCWSSLYTGDDLSLRRQAWRTDVPLYSSSSIDMAYLVTLIYYD